MPDEIRRVADRAYENWQKDSKHPSLDFKPRKGCKKIKLWSARVGLHYRAVCTKDGQDWLWFWIGIHAEYDKLKC